jgi:hypothetical protein
VSPKTHARSYCLFELTLLVRDKEDIPAIQVDARASVNTAATMIKTVGISAPRYHEVYVLLTIIGKDSSNKLYPREQPEAHYDDNQTDEDNVRRPYLRSFGRCIAKVKLADVHAYTANDDKLPRHGGGEAKGCLNRETKSRCMYQQAYT